MAPAIETDLARNALRLMGCVAPASAVEAMREEAEPAILPRLTNLAPNTERNQVGSYQPPGRASVRLTFLLPPERIRNVSIDCGDAASFTPRPIEPRPVPVSRCDRKYVSTASTASTICTANTAQHR
jgi:hypothetical protein